MPQVDLEALVSACAGASCDNKIACETLAGEERPPAEDDLDSDADSSPELPAEEIPPDFPPESFWLSKDAEFDWFDRNAYYERKESTKGNSNSTNLNPSLVPSSNSSSQRFSVNRKSRAALLGLPKPQKSCFVDSKNRRNAKAGNTRLFPKRSGSTGKSEAPVIEPSSPKVSCMGRVRSKKDRNRRLRTRQRSKSSEPAPQKVKPAGRRRAGFLSSFRSMFRSGRRSERESGDRQAPRGYSPPRRSSASITRDIRERLPPRDLDAPSSESLSLPRRSAADGEPPGLGGMMRFASGRRSDAWVNDVA
ncbi:uncharacterized protein LOC116195480 [Punica granatum]|uniref:Serine/arginine repetitive matrix protein 1-like n=2 Tax=Punica granatum TaxID=22663 RepID=A0A218X2X1_PUNGR|nr:uncharacterized protein LOC116195480 [Punica granatum]OWM79079.1 hypothetical protein CDL15_Pgr003250 [Punica granatum]PKI49348.1 hypothetical protein CRG98_030276 [Punica granatum]